MQRLLMGANVVVFKVFHTVERGNWLEWMEKWLEDDAEKRNFGLCDSKNAIITREDS